MSDEMDKTVVVACVSTTASPIPSTKKIVGRTYKLKAHDETMPAASAIPSRVMEAPSLSQGQALARKK